MHKAVATVPAVSVRKINSPSETILTKEPRGFDRLDLLGCKTTFGADDECDMAVDIAPSSASVTESGVPSARLSASSQAMTTRSYSASSRQMSSSPVGSSTMGRMCDRTAGGGKRDAAPS